MHISSAALLLLIPATWAATIPVVNTVDGIVESAVIVTNPSIVSRENKYFSRDVSKTNDGIQIPDVDLESAEELASALIDPNTITGRGLEDLTSILKEISNIKNEINNIKEDLKKSLAEANEIARDQIKEIFAQLNSALQRLLQRIVEILNGEDDELGPRDVGKTAEETHRLAQGLLEVLVDLSTLRGVVEEQIKELTGAAREEAEKQIANLRGWLGDIKGKIVEAIIKHLEREPRDV